MGALAHNAFYLVIGQAMTTALGIVFSAAVGRSLGPSEFGLWYLLTSATTFAYVFVDWGYAPYVIREVALFPERAGELTGTVMAVRATTALVVCAPAVVATLLLGYDARTRALTAMMMAAWLPMFLALSFSWTFRGRERMDFDALVNVVLKAFTLALTLMFLALGGGLVAVMLASAIGGMIAIGLAMRLYSRLHLPPLTATLRTARELVRGAAPMFTMVLAVQVQPYIDANLLSKLTPRGVVGWYGAAATFGGTLLAPALILVSAVYPRMSRAAANQAEFKRLVENALRPVLLVAVLGAVGTYLFADVAVSVVYSRPNFGPATAILRAFAPVLFLVSVDLLLATAILAAGKATQFACAKLITVLLTTGLDFLLIPVCQTRFGNGGIGVMVALAGGEAVMIVAALYLIPRGLLDRRALLALARALLAGAGAVLITRALGPVPPFVALPACVFAYAAFSVAVGLVTRADIEQLAVVLTRREGTVTVTCVASSESSAS